MGLPGKLLALMLFFCFAGSSFAESTLKSYGDVEGRVFHARLYKGDKQCVACHDTTVPVSLPADGACLGCHDLEELVVATARPKADVWQNPHNNLHWGKDVPCIECHGEHQQSKPLCQGCHSFDYPNYKP